MELQYRAAESRYGAIIIGRRLSAGIWRTRQSLCAEVLDTRLHRALDYVSSSSSPQVLRSENKALLRGGASGLNVEIFGAWAPPSEDCRKVFILDGRRFSFRDPVDKSSLAFNKEVDSASKTCSVAKML
jgi:hypothetical protein